MSTLNQQTEKRGGVPMVAQILNVADRMTNKGILDRAHRRAAPPHGGRAGVARGGRQPCAARLHRLRRRRVLRRRRPEHVLQRAVAQHDALAPRFDAALQLGRAAWFTRMMVEMPLDCVTGTPPT